MDFAKIQDREYRLLLNLFYKQFEILGGIRMKTVALVPIKLNSERLPHKNILPIG